MTLINHNSNKYKVVGTRPIRHDALDKVTGKHEEAVTKKAQIDMFE